jgi:hypothetical protein
MGRGDFPGSLVPGAHGEAVVSPVAVEAPLTTYGPEPVKVMWLLAAAR